MPGDCKITENKWEIKLDILENSCVTRFNFVIEMMDAIIRWMEDS